jgi:hypothetical protein
MKTLSKEITATFFSSTEGYAQLMTRWSRTMQDRAARKRLTAAHHLLYLILRGKNWQKAFAPVTNPTKLEHGGFYNWKARSAVMALHCDGNRKELLAPFADLIRAEALCAIRQRVPNLAWDENPLDREPYDG